MQKSDPSKNADSEIVATNEEAFLLLTTTKQQWSPTMAPQVAFAKQKLFETGDLKKQDCLFCELGPSFVTVQQRDELAQLYRTDITFSGFHCGKQFHADLFHHQLFDFDVRWSCCENDHFRQED